MTVDVRTIGSRQLPLDGTHRNVVVVGGGQAGLSMSWWLRHRGLDHVVLESARACHEWRDRRWDSFCLVTPNWPCALPGFICDGDDPDGFMVRSQIEARGRRPARPPRRRARRLPQRPAQPRPRVAAARADPC